MSEKTKEIIASHSIGRGYIPADCACSHDHVFKSVNIRLPDIRKEFPDALTEGTVSMEDLALPKIAIIKEPITPVFQKTSGGRE